MYQNEYRKMSISVGIYNINRPEAGYVGGVHLYIYIYVDGSSHVARKHEVSRGDEQRWHGRLYGLVGPSSGPAAGHGRVVRAGHFGWGFEVSSGTV